MNAALCPDAATLSSFANGHLPDDKLQEVADHLDTCSACRSTVEQCSGTSDPLLVAVREQVVEDQFSQEAEYQNALALVRDFGREASTGTTPNAAELPLAAVPQQLAAIRDYDLLGQLGEGGMGAVYKARHRKLKKIVALKVLPRDRMQDVHAVARFEREMEAVGTLEHPNIVRATDAGEADGTHYLVMELVEGIDLSKLVRKVGRASKFATGLPTPAKPPTKIATGLPTPAKPPTEGLPNVEQNAGRPAVEPVARSGDLATTRSADLATTQAASLRHTAMTIPDACELIRQAAVGLQYAHKRGLVHRDIKPSNLMLAAREGAVPSKVRNQKPAIVKILDLGLALLGDQHAGQQHDLTNTGQMMGTLDYMAPEQGSDSHQVDIRADIYALGATLYKLLSGEAPFPSSKYNTLVKRLMALATEQVPSIATQRDDLPAELVAIVDRMLARNPDNRFAEPEEVAEALAPFCVGCDLGLLLKHATAEDAESAEDESKVVTHESLKSDSVETAPTIDIQSSPHAPREEIGVAGVEQREPPAAFPSTAATAAKPGGSLRSTPATPSPRHPLTRSPRRPLSRSPRSPRLLLTAAALAAFILLSAIIFYIKTNHGTIVVEIDDPSVSVTVQGEDIQITKDDSGEAYQIKPGDHTLHVKHGDLEFDTDKFTLTRGEKVVLSVRLVEGEVRVVQKDVEQTVIGSRPLLPTPKPSTPSTTPSSASNYALAFDGKSSYVEMASLKFDTGKANTLEAWFSATSPSPPKQQNIIQGCEPGFPTLHLQGHWAASCTLDGGKSWRTQKSNNVANRNIRTHVAAMWTGTESILFVDGKRQQETLPSYGGKSNWLASKPFEIGTGRNEATHPNYVRTFFFHGIVDEVRISSVARYDKEFTPAERFEPDEHTQALYHFDEGQGEIAQDSSPNKHHGKIVGAKWVNDYLLNDPEGKIALLVLNSGGTIEVEKDGKNKRVASLDELPKEPFEYLKIDLAGASFPITDSSLDALEFQRLEQLKELNLSGAEVTDGSLVHLREMKNLRVLNLTACPVGDYGLRYLPKSLSGVTLTGTEITDFAARWLSGLTQLEYLDVKGTQLSAEFVAKLKLVLPNCGIASDYPRRDIDKLVEKLRAAKTEREDLFAIKPVPIPEIQPGEPLASWALTTSPAKLEGVRSWTIETRATRSNLGRQVLFSGDGKLLAAGDWAVKFWRAHDRCFENALVNSSRFDNRNLEPGTSPKLPLIYIRWSPDSTKLAIGASVWDVAQWRHIGVFVAPGQHGTEIQGADWSPDGKLLATCDNQGWVVIWDMERSRTVDKFSVAGASFSMVRWSYDGKYLAAADRTDLRTPVIIWEFETGDRVELPHLPAHWFEWSPVANELAISSLSTLTLFDLARGDERWSVEVQDTAPLPAWSPDAAYLLTRAGTVLNAKTGREIRKLDTKSTPGHFSWSPDGMLIAIGEINGDLEFFRGTSPIPFDAIQGIGMERVPVVRWSQDGKEVAPTGITLTGLSPSTIPVWSMDGNTVVGKSSPNNRLSIASSDTEGWRSITFENGVNIQSRAVSPDGRYVVVSGQARSTAIVGDVGSNKVVHELNDKGEVKLVAWSPAGNLIATVSYSSPTYLVSLWDSETAERKAEFKVSGARAIAFSPDGKQLAVETGSSTELWSVETLKMVAKFQQAASVATPLAWLDESTLAIACADGVLRVFNTTDSTLVREIQNIGTSEAMFSSDGRQYVWSIGGSAVRVVDVANGKPLGTMLYLRDEQWLAVSPEGHFKGSKGISDRLIYIVQTDDGVQHTLTPAEFAEQYNWKNDPTKVQLAD